MPSASVTVIGLAVRGGGILVITTQMPLPRTLLVCTEFVRPTVGMKVNLNPPPLFVGEVMTVGSGLVTASVA